MYGHSQPEPQPEWRLPPRPGRRAESPLPPPPPPPPPRPPTTTAVYSPATYGPISNSPVNPSVSPVPTAVPGTDPRTWGVRYNQQPVHPIHAPPALPPRPSSTNEQPYAYTYAQQTAPPPPAPAPAPAPVLAPAINTAVTPPHPSHGYESFADVQLPSATSTIPPPYSPSHQKPATEAVPPPPPKVPQGHQYAPAELNHPPERPPLLAQGVGPAATQGSYSFRPPALSTAETSASALGPGTPSDWEHLGPTPGDFDDSPWFPPRQSEPIPQETIQTPPGYSSGIPSPGITSHATGPLHRVETNYQCHHQANPSALSQPGHGRRNGSLSPISPMTAQGAQSPPPPARIDSVSSGHSMRSHAESIDNVIDAWVRPLAPTSKSGPPENADTADRSDYAPLLQSNVTTPVEAPRPLQSIPTQASRQETSPSAATPTESQGRSPAARSADPYEDLDPWFKSSLTRYVAMLRKEAVADSDEERYKIFTAFMSKETKLREILYNIEPVSQPSPPAPKISEPTQQVSPSSEEKRKPVYESGLIPVETEEIMTPNTPTATTEDGNDTDDVGSEYSAGGRPILAKRARRGSHWMPKLSSLPSEGNTTGQPLEENAQRQTLEPLTINPPRPIYTPFQYTEGPQRGSDKLSFDRPAYQAYSDLRASAVNGRLMSNAPQPHSRSRSGTLSTAPAQNEHDETFLGIIRHRSTAYLETSHRGSMPSSLLPEALRKGQGKLNGPVEELRAMVWTPLDKQTESSWHITIREDLAKLPDDFSYIQSTIDGWENTAKVRRQDLDRERSVRQEESEAQIDNLFNEKEIGYADINTLEEDFRQTEARVQLDEERQEVEDFISKVFNPLDERLKEEISALRKSYDSALNQLDRDQKGKNSPVEKCSPSVTMKMVNEIHSKLELRFQKRLEIALDCERRRKKAERRPLVFMGDMASLRKLDGDFDRMEKRNILEAAKDRDDRANRLMDSFDDAILHGLGMNQSLLDELATKAARLDPTTLRASGLPDSEVEQILKSAATFAASLRADSEAILHCSGVADMALNDADYNVSVAEARYANSEPEIFARLEDEKKKEDAILETDLNSKLQSINKSPGEIEMTIQRLLRDLASTPDVATLPASQDIDDEPPLAINKPADVPSPLELRPATVAPTPAPASAPVPSSTPVSMAQTEHEQRMRKALEDAKKRNAARN
ncbi:hypothetical protein N7532_011203 [Penicillium argentinense]|uniref:Uncharacterized protein n=1 Tax=Penicillium argentinense TaxID=1131581 RepID=A0A9W9EI40_9EURO|nr:uncharacterized protein N7532_011203 [Penicillium argentinense]KAJ5082160.1 hypothetical protein N7532_011203 [Penicillium argentinense]